MLTALCALRFQNEKEKRDKLWQFLVELDRKCNLYLLNGEDETISSRAGKAVANGNKVAILLCGFLHLLDKGHCAKSIEEPK
jgi:hypothetical protein